MTGRGIIIARNILTLLIVISTGHLPAQIVFNEASGRNDTQIYDEDGDSKDWFELYNSSDEIVSLEGWTVTDDPLRKDKWIFPSLTVDPGAFQFIWASGKGNNAIETDEIWETAILPSSTFSYIIPDENVPDNWKTIGFDDQDWQTGEAGFGYGDDDDNTVVPDGTVTVYIRSTFDIPDTNSIKNAVCHMDYDDGFVAYINGVEICRKNIDGDPQWNSLSTGQHDAVMIEGRNPEAFEIDIASLSGVWMQGENVFAVEVHNVSDQSSDLSIIPFLSFSTETGNSSWFPVPSWFLTAHNYSKHTNFKIDSKGESLYLFNNEGAFIDSLYVARTPVDYSVGREKDGSEILAVFKRATPERTNNNSVAYIDGYEPSPLIYPPSGFYEDSIEVSLLTLSQTAVIRYTLDGSEPTQASLKYNGEPITINESNVIIAKTFSSLTKKLDGISAKASYFIDEEYSIPVLSVITNNSNLYGSSGIFTNWQQSWNKPSYVEYFDTDKNLAFRQDAGMQIDGGAGGSRSQPQHSFRIEPDHGTYGEGSVQYRLQPDRPDRESYASFYVRNGSNQYLVLPYKDGAEVKGMGKNTYTYYSAYRPIAVHINGKFFGIYELREKLNEDFLINAYGMDTDSLELLGVSYFKGMWLQPLIGTIDNYMADYEYFLGLDPESPDYLENIGSFLDLKNYTDYIIGETWIANTDWPQNNIKVFRCKSTDYKWRFMLIDLEWSLRPNYWSTSSTDHIAYMNERAEENLYIIFWYRMMQTEEYRNYFLNRFADLMNTNYHFDNLGKIEEEMFDEYYPEMHKEYERWSGSNVEDKMEDFVRNHNIFRSELRVRSSRVRSHLVEHYDIDQQIYMDLDVNPPGAGRIKISSIMPSEYPWRGIYFSDIPITFKAIPNPGYVFTSWEENENITDTGNSEFTSLFPGKYNDVIANFAPGTSDFKGLTISEINYKDGIDFPSTDWFEILNANNTDLNLEAWYFTDKDTAHKYVFSPGTIIPANERMVVAQELDYFKYNYPEVENYTGGFLFGFDEFIDEINLYNSLGEKVLSVSYSNNYPWPLEGKTDGRTLELLDPAGDINDPENWIAGCPKGSPGKAYEKCSLSLSAEENYATGSEEDIDKLILYPNPFNDYVMLDFYLEKPADELEIKIYNMLGSLVKIENFESFNKGNQSIHIDLSDLAGEIYYLVLSTGKFRKSLKLLKQN